MQDFHYWAIAGIVLLMTEMVSGTFFLLVLGLAALTGGLAAWLGSHFWGQASFAALIAVAGTLWVHQHRQRHKQIPSLPAFDIGQPVTFEQWTSESDGLARVNYRGTTWDARLAPGLSAAPGSLLFIESIEGNILHLSGKKP